MSSAGKRYTIRKHSNGTVSVIDGTTGDVAQVSGALLIGLSWELASSTNEIKPCDFGAQCQACIDIRLTLIEYRMLAELLVEHSGQKAPAMMNLQHSRWLSQADLSTIQEIFRQAKLQEPAKYDWRRVPPDNRTSATGWDGGDEVGHIGQISNLPSKHRWAWAVTATLVLEFEARSF